MRLNPNICKYWEFGEVKVLGYGTKSDMSFKYGTIFLLLHDITNEKTLKLKQIDRLPALPRFSPQKHVKTTLIKHTYCYIYLARTS